MIPVILSMGKKIVDLVILDGQSNNKGKGLVSELPSRLTGQISKQYIWHNGGFEALEAGVNQTGYALTAGGSEDLSEFGPELEFAYNRSIRGQSTYIVKVGRGGKRLIETAGDVDFSENSTGELHDNMVTTVLTAIAYLESQGNKVNVMGYFWTQGEADGSVDEITADAYETNLINKINAVRSDLSLPNLKFYISKLSSEQTNVTYLDTIRTAQVAVNSAVSNTEIISTDIFEVGDDNLHFTTNGQISLGGAFYNATE